MKKLKNLAQINMEIPATPPYSLNIPVNGVWGCWDDDIAAQLVADGVCEYWEAGGVEATDGPPAGDLDQPDRGQPAGSVA